MENWNGSRGERGRERVRSREGGEGGRGDREVFPKERLNTDQLASLGFFVSISSVTNISAADPEPSLKTNYFSIRRYMRPPSDDFI